MVIGSIVIAMSALGGFWWLLDESSIAQGALGTAIIGAFAFNRAHIEGKRWFNRTEVKMLYIPVFVINLIAFTIGVWLKT